LKIAQPHNGRVRSFLKARVAKSDSECRSDRKGLRKARNGLRNGCEG
jgi:hypothetical protein